MASFDWYSKARSRLWKLPNPAVWSVPKWALIVATFFFAGLFPVASGTVGSFVAAFLYYIIPALHDTVTLVIATLVVLILGIIASNAVERSLKEKDSSIIVADEVIGQWITFIGVPYLDNPLYIFIGFLYFRLFDIVKLYPASVIEQKEGGAAVMLDDAVAGIYANIATHITVELLHRIL